MFAAFIILPTRFWPRNDRELPFLAIALKILRSIGRCARHFLAYETVCYAYRSKRCTLVYAVPSAQVSSLSPRAFSSSFANLHLTLVYFFALKKKNLNSILVLTLFKMLLGFTRTIYPWYLLIGACAALVRSFYVPTDSDSATARPVSVCASSGKWKRGYTAVLGENSEHRCTLEYPQRYRILYCGYVLYTAAAVAFGAWVVLCPEEEKQVRKQKLCVVVQS